MLNTSWDSVGKAHRSTSNFRPDILHIPKGKVRIISGILWS